MINTLFNELTSFLHIDNAGIIVYDESQNKYISYIESEESSEDYYEAYFQDRIYTLSIPAEKLTDGKTLIIQM